MEGLGRLEDLVQIPDQIESYQIYSNIVPYPQKSKAGVYVCNCNQYMHGPGLVGQLLLHQELVGMLFICLKS